MNGQNTLNHVTWDTQYQIIKENDPQEMGNN